ncbi:MAG: hypothetical protein GF353_01565 [Candidatus Lokiarchaeota archaeon]|nr:hypothetical protein [Candidatus Lokiarchaeota archaeon]
MIDSVLLDNKGHMAISSDSKIKSKHTEDGFFIICPHCSFENSTITYMSSEGLPQFKLA